MPKWWSSVALVAVVAVAAGSAQTNAGHVLLQKAGLSEVPASYTALAFAHPQSLPAQLGSKKSSTYLLFVIRNVSGPPHFYHWQVLLRHGEHTQDMAAGQVRLPSHGETTIGRTVTTSCVGGRIDLIVHLTAPAESINFWAACWPAKRSGS
jgi:hypothetical protein